MYLGINVDKIKPYKSSWYQQFIGCLWRSWKSIIKEPAIIRIRVIQNIVSSLSIAKTCSQSYKHSTIVIYNTIVELTRNLVSRILTTIKYQVFAVVVGIIYFDQGLTQTSIVNINGVLFWTIMNQVFTTYSTVLNVSILFLLIQFFINYKIPSSYCLQLSFSYFLNSTTHCLFSIIQKSIFIIHSFLKCFFLFVFVFSIQLTVNVQYKFLPLTGFEPRASGVRIDRSTH